MLKPTGSFKLSKSTKRSIALMRGKTNEQRSAWKRAMIDAELSAEIAKKTAGKRSKDKAE